MLENIKAIFFDMDGTIIDSMWMWRNIDIEFLGKRGIELPENLQRDIEGMSFTETAVFFKNRFNLNERISYKNKINTGIMFRSNRVWLSFLRMPMNGES